MNFRGGWRFCDDFEELGWARNSSGAVRSVFLKCRIGVSVVLIENNSLIRLLIPWNKYNSVDLCRISGIMIKYHQCDCIWIYFLVFSNLVMKGMVNVFSKKIDNSLETLQLYWVVRTSRFLFYAGKFHAYDFKISVLCFTIFFFFES